MSKDLLKEAIADAKAVRETAIANAKLALEEAFTPKLQSMLSSKIAEDMEDEEMEDEVPVDDVAVEQEDELDAEIPADDEAEVEGTYEQEDGMEDEVPAEEEPTDDVAVEQEDELEDEVPADEEGAEDLELEAIIRELEDENGEEEVPADEEEPVTEQEEEVPADDEEAEMETENIDLDEVIKSLTEEDEEGTDTDLDTKEDPKEKELGEAYNTIRSLKSTLQEVNLLNAKLLFSNKLFKVNNLSESQKMKVIETFDRASNLREVKLVYSTLAESFTGKTVAKKRVTEGLASKKSNSTAPKGKIVESNGMADRMKRLAGLL